MALPENIKSEERKGIGVVNTPNSFIIKISKIEAKNLVKGEAEVTRDPNGEPSYLQHDVIGLNKLLNLFDSRKHQLRDMQRFIAVRDKVLNAYYETSDKIVFTLDEAAFLKDYLKELKDKDAKDQPLQEFEIRTLLGVIDQLEK